MPTPDLLIKKENMILKNEHKFDEVYEIGKKNIGSGAFGTVSKCVHKPTG